MVVVLILYIFSCSLSYPPPFDLVPYNLSRMYLLGCVTWLLQKDDIVMSSQSIVNFIARLQKGHSIKLT
jgi:hypothetical protein